MTLRASQPSDSIATEMRQRTCSPGWSCAFHWWNHPQRELLAFHWHLQDPLVDWPYVRLKAEVLHADAPSKGGS